MRHQEDQVHRLGAAKVAEVGERARREEVGEVRGQLEEGIKFFKVLGCEIGLRQAFDLMLELSLAELR